MNPRYIVERFLKNQFYCFLRIDDRWSRYEQFTVIILDFFVSDVQCVPANYTHVPCLCSWYWLDVMGIGANKLEERNAT